MPHVTGGHRETGDHPRSRSQSAADWSPPALRVYSQPRYLCETHRSRPRGCFRKWHRVGKLPLTQAREASGLAEPGSPQFKSQSQYLLVPPPGSRRWLIIVSCLFKMGFHWIFNHTEIAALDLGTKKTSEIETIICYPHKPGKC